MYHVKYMGSFNAKKNVNYQLYLILILRLILVGKIGEPLKIGERCMEAARSPEDHTFGCREYMTHASSMLQQCP